MNKTNSKKDVDVLKGGHQPKKTNKPEAKDPPTGASNVKKVISNDNVDIKKFDDLEGKFLLVRVGTQAVPANDTQIENIREKLVGLFEKNNINCLTFVTHHAVDISIIEKNGV